MEIEQIFPGIYLTLADENIWTAEKLRLHGFTHIIRIDKNHTNNNNNDEHFEKIANNKSEANLLNSKSCCTTTTENSNIQNNNNKNRYEDFETLDLNFGEKAYLTTVLPNCYKGVKFIDGALKSGGAVLIIDQINHEKCITVVVGFLMYKDNLKFSTAFQIVKEIHPNVALDRYYETQLYEYEPILQVQRTLLHGGNSCSRELRSTFLKRKKTFDEFPVLNSTASSELSTLPSAQSMVTTADPIYKEHFLNIDNYNTDILME